MAIRHLYRYSITLILGIAVCICGYAVSSKLDFQPSPPQTITLHFGKQGVKDFYTYTNNENDDYPRIMSFYELNWHPPKLGHVNIHHSGKTLTIKYIFYLMATHLKDRFDGIGAIDMAGGLSEEDFVTPEQAYQGYVSLINELNDKGWQQYFQFNEARYSKTDNMKLLLRETNGLNLLQSGTTSDTSQVLSYEDWRKIFKGNDGRIWSDLYLRDIILHLEIDKTPSSKDNYEQYTVSYKFDTVKYRFFTSLNSEERDLDIKGWKNIYDHDVMDNKKTRENEEQKAKQAGYHIDETYQDPDMWQYIIEPAY